MTLLGIDVSSCQGPNIDWPRVAAEGVRFVIAKATEGLTGRDPQLARNLAGARAAGITVGEYHFARVSQGRAEEQVKALWDASGDTLPAFVALDLESAPDAMLGSEIVAFAERFAEECRSRFGRWPLFYTYPAFAQRLGPSLAASAVLSGCPLWIAHYRWSAPGLPPATMQPIVPQPWTRWTIWQFSADKGARIPGIPTDIDRNVFAGDEAAFRAFCGLPTADQIEPDAGVVHVLDYSSTDDPPFPPDEPPAAA